MTPAEKLALCRRSYAAFNAGPDIDALLSLYHRDCEWLMGPMGVAAGTEAFRGHEGLRAWVAAIDEGLEGFRAEIDEARISRNGDVLLRAHVNVQSRVEHAELSTPKYWQEIGFRDGLCVRVVQYDEPPAGWDEATRCTSG